MPPAGGGPTRLQSSYGNWGLFENLDYYGTDDLSAIWWDPLAEGIDEIGREGVGMWRFVDGGARFTVLDAPVPAPFVVDGTVVTYDTPPPGDVAPTYPPPLGSPADG